MKIKNILLGLTIAAFSLTSCEKAFDELEKDPNRPVSAPASLVLNGILNDMYSVTGSPWGSQQRYNQFYCSNYDYYATNEYNWTTTGLSFSTLKNVIKMEEQAKAAGGADVNPYSALGKFFRAYFYEDMTKRVGDLPLTDALKGLDNSTPKYNTQKEVYVQVLKWLDESNADLTTLIANGNKTLSGDIYLGNNLRQWQKVVNSFKLRVLVSLSKKETDTDLNIKARFAEVVSNPTKFPVMGSLSDNLQYTHNTINKYPRNPDNFGNNATRENMSKTYIDLLVDRKDPRIFIVAEPADAKIKAGLKATDFAAYVGASSGEDLADMSTKALKGEYSFLGKKRYYTNYIGEAVAIISYSETCFNIAEGINRGWATGSAEDFYIKGITASMSFYGISDAATLNTYLGGNLVKYAASTGLSQILTQKYLAFAQNSGMEAWYNQRRTGIPNFLVGVGTGNSGRIPKRWQYPSSELSTNKDNLKAALTSQFTSGNDDINDVLWLLK
jgi:hypothetical protein